jgi:hypothetical protein
MVIDLLQQGAQPAVVAQPPTPSVEVPELAIEHAVASADDPTDALDRRFAEAIAIGKEGRPKEAFRLLSEVVAEQTNLLGQHHRQTLLTRVEHAYWKSKSGHARAVIDDVQRMLPVVTKEFGAADRRTLRARFVLAEVLGESGEPDLAIRSLEALIPDQTKALGRKDADTHRSRFRLAHWLSVHGRPEQAVTILKPLAIEQGGFFGNNLESHITKLALGRCQAESGDLKRARTTLKNLLAEQQRVLSNDEPVVFETRYWLACAHVDAGDVAKGLPMLDDLLVDQRRTLGDRHNDTQRTVYRIAKLRARY